MYVVGACVVDDLVFVPTEVIESSVAVAVTEAVVWPSDKGTLAMTAATMSLDFMITILQRLGWRHNQSLSILNFEAARRREEAKTAGWN